MKDAELRDLISEKVFQALGQASMCWDMIPVGVFDSSRAKRIGDELIQEILSIIKPNVLKFDPQSMDAVVWAKEFMQIYLSHKNAEGRLFWIDEDLMRGWFANAIMAGYDEARRRYEKPNVLSEPKSILGIRLKPTEEFSNGRWIGHEFIEEIIYEPEPPTCTCDIGQINKINYIAQENPKCPIHNPVSKTEVSKCCNASVHTNMSPDFIGDNPKTQIIGTCYYICDKCGEACDLRKEEK